MQTSTKIILDRDLYKKTVISTIITDEGMVEIYKTADSGKVITREKIDTITKVFHPGIIIGEDMNNQVWVAHNHYSNKRPTFDLFESFSLGGKAFWDNREVHFSKEAIVMRAIAEVRAGKKYRWLKYNCQTFVNLIVRNATESEAVDRIANVAVAGGLVTSFIGLLSGNKKAVAAGLAIAGIGGLAKGVSRTR